MKLNGMVELIIAEAQGNYSKLVQNWDFWRTIKLGSLQQDFPLLLRLKIFY